MTVYTRSELIVLLRENALIKSGEAWSRIDGGQDLCIGAMLADQSADAIAEMQSELAATKAALAEVETAMSNTNETLQRLGELYGCQPGSRRIDWLKEHLANSAARVAKLEAGLKRISGQKLVSEMDDEVADRADFEDAYNQLVFAARAALVQEAGK